MSLGTAIRAFSYRAVPRRERFALLGYSAGLTAILGFIASWIFFAADDPARHWCRGYSQEVDSECLSLVAREYTALGIADLFALGVLALGLFVIAPAAVAAGVSTERRSGTLDQLRTTPLSPLGLVLGLALGAPLRVYLLLVGPLVLHVGAAVFGAVPLDVLAFSLAVLLVGGVASVLFAMVVALAPRVETGSAQAALAVALVLFAGSLFAGFAPRGGAETAAFVFMHPAGALSASLLLHPGLYRLLHFSPWSLHHFHHADYMMRLALSPLLSCLCSLVLSWVMARAACRRLARPDAPLFGKPLALAAFVALALAVLLPLGSLISSHCDYFQSLLGVSVVLLPVATLLALFAAPSGEAYLMALRSGAPVRPFADAAAPYVLLWTMEVVVVVLTRALLPFQHTFAFDLDGHALAVGWFAVVALTLPVLVHALAAREGSPAARGVLGTAFFAHLFIQGVVIAIAWHDHSLSDSWFTPIAATAAVLVPALTALGLRSLHRRH